MSKPHHLRPLLGIAVLVFLIAPGVQGTNWKNGSAFKPDLIEVCKNAAKFGIDPTRVAAGGGSAGGHLPAATATSKIINEDTDDLSLSNASAALVLFNPVLGHRDSVNRWKPEVRTDFM